LEYLFEYAGKNQEIKNIHSLFSNDNNSRSIELLEWQYGKDSYPSSKVLFAISKDNELAGMYASYSCAANIFEKTGRVSISLNTLIDKHHRRKGLFVNLAKAQYDWLIENSVDLIIGFPNKFSQKGLFHNLNWTDAGPIPFRIKFLNWRFFLRKLKIPVLRKEMSIERFYSSEGNKNIREIKKFDGQATELWSKFIAQNVIAINRSEEFLNWRFCNKPNFKYKSFGIYNSENRLTAFITCQLVEKYDSNALLIMEFIYDLKEEIFASKLIDYVIRLAKQCNAEIAMTWSFKHAPNFDLFQKKAFVKFPNVIKPTHFGFLPLNYQNKKLQRSDFYISYADADWI